VKVMQNKNANEKIRKIHEIIENKGISGILINNLNNFSWLTGSRGFIGIATEKSCCTILITLFNLYFIINNIEVNRFKDEEFSDIAGDIIVYPWFNEEKKFEIIGSILSGGICLDDEILFKEFQLLRSVMNKDELEKLQWLGLTVAESTEKIAGEILPGCTEYDVWGMLANEALKNGIEPITFLVGFDDRAFKYRHPLPTQQRLEKFAMLVTCARKWGLCVSCTRFVSFSKLNEELNKKFNALACIDSALISGTRPGVIVKDIFKNCLDLYKEAGYENEWQNHHQGGLSGYAVREYKANERTENKVELNQVYVWNPSLSGAKMEDTIVVQTNENKIITHTGKYEYINVEYSGCKMHRPGVLIRNKLYNGINPVTE
jgi:Xaa-Pro dipeptidase